MPTQSFHSENHQTSSNSKLVGDVIKGQKFDQQGNRYKAKDEIGNNSINNIGRMTEMSQTDEFLYIHHRVYGYVFATPEIQKAGSEGYGRCSPILRLFMSQKVGGYPRILSLTCQKGYDGAGVTLQWLKLFVDQISQVALNLKSLRGSFDLRSPLLDLVSNGDDYQARLYDSRGQEVVCADLNTNSYDDAEWEAKRQNEDLVLILGVRGDQ